MHRNSDNMELSKRQAEIIERSIEIIASKGIQGLTIKNLSREIGISEPAIYRHFTNKIDILLTLLESFKEMSEMFASMLETFQGTAIEKIRFLFSNMIDVFNETPALVSVIFSEEIFSNESILKNKMIEIQSQNQTTIEKIISQGKREHNVRDDIDSIHLALIIMGALRLLVKNWSLSSYNFDLRKEGNKLIRSLEAILQP